MSCWNWIGYAPAEKMNLTNMNFEQCLKWNWIRSLIFFSLHFNLTLCSREDAGLSVFNPTMSLIHLKFHRISFYLSVPLSRLSLSFARSHFSLRRYDYSNVQLLKMLRNTICSISFVKCWINQLWFSKLFHSIALAVTTTITAAAAIVASVAATAVRKKSVGRF